jgi:hypothetical protein
MFSQPVYDTNFQTAVGGALTTFLLPAIVCVLLLPHCESLLDPDHGQLDLDPCMSNLDASSSGHLDIV